MSIATLRIEELSKRYGYARALAGVSLELRAGSLCALLGPNGAGKSTLLGIVSTLIRPSRGRVRYLASGQGEIAPKAVRGQIGVLAHEAFVYRELTGRENLQFFGQLYGLSSLDARVATTLERVGLSRKAADKPVKDYSRGMTQRLAIARTLLHQPQILLLDEPFTGLDRQGSALLLQLLEEARRDGKLILVVTHDLQALAGQCDHAVVLRRGRIVAQERGESTFAYADLLRIYEGSSDSAAASTSGPHSTQERA